MIITFKPLWKLLIDRDMTREDLRHAAGLSPATIAKLGRDGNVTTDVLARICQALDCNLEQIASATTRTDPDEHNSENA
ncbi:helix-turn-helix transcriptional regulator [Cutibacterium avidum]